MLVLNDLRSRIVVQTDGKLQTGRDVAIAALLGAEEFGFSTAPLVAMGCIMMRKCHLNTCPVGIATQDPVLRKKFARHARERGQFLLLHRRAGARDTWRAWASARFDEMVGRVDMLEMRPARGSLEGARAGFFADSLQSAERRRAWAAAACIAQDHGLEAGAGRQADRLRRAGASKTARRSSSCCPSATCDRTVGAMLSGEIARQHGSKGLEPDTIHFRFNGSAGQSFGAFLARGVTLELEGDANDYVGKGLSGGKLIVYPPRNSTFLPEENILIGNVVLYGATSGEAFFNGRAGERFAVRNSGATAVVEGVGDHGCEYMTKGLVVVIQRHRQEFRGRHDRRHRLCAGRNRRVPGTPLQPRQRGSGPAGREGQRGVCATGSRGTPRMTGSPRANWILENWDAMLPKFVKVFPHEYQASAGREARRRWRRMGKVTHG